MIGQCPTHGLPLTVLRPHWRAGVWTCPLCNEALNARSDERLAAMPPLPADPFEALMVLFGDRAADKL
jgi:hypothetical protein